MMKPSIRFIFSADTEDAPPNYLPGWKHFGSDYDCKPPLIKSGWTRFWDHLLDLFEKQGIIVTWHMRVDAAMTDQFLRKNRQMIEKLKNRGHEIGIHIHTLVWDGSIWRQSLDEAEQKEIVSQAIACFREVLGFSPHVSRMGWNAMTSAIMETLDAEGIQVDGSAIPGYRSSGKVFGGRDNIMDWSRTPSYCYHPSKHDYQEQGDLSIMECPISAGGEKSMLYAAAQNIIPSFLSKNVLSTAASCLKRMRMSPYTYLSISPYWGIEQAKKLIRYALKKGQPVLHGYFHPSDILEPATGNMDKTFMKKLDAFLSYLKKRAPIESIPLSGVMR